MHRFLLAVLLAAPVWAQPHPDFSGTWKLNVTESDYSDKRASPPDSLVVTLRQKGRSLKYALTNERGGKKIHFSIDLDFSGAPHVSDEVGIVSIEWKGASIVVSTLYNPDNERRSDQSQTWTLSADGRKLIDEVLVHPPKNAPEVRIKRVFEKQ
jgi:hypothetical protein